MENMFITTIRHHSPRDMLLRLLRVLDTRRLPRLIDVCGLATLVVGWVKVLTIPHRYRQSGVRHEEENTGKTLGIESRLEEGTVA